MFNYHLQYKQVAYTTDALCWAKNIDPADSACDSDITIDPANHLPIINKAEEAVVHTNVAYTNSGINFQLRLVYTHHTPTYRDTGKTCGQVISALQDQYDDNMDDVHDIRNLWGADAVALLTGNRVSGCGGVAYVGHYSPYSFSNWMFSVTLAPYATGGTFGHEVGWVCLLLSFLLSCLLMYLFLLRLGIIWAAYMIGWNPVIPTSSTSTDGMIHRVASV